MFISYPLTAVIWFTTIFPSSAYNPATDTSQSFIFCVVSLALLYSAYIYDSVRNKQSTDRLLWFVLPVTVGVSSLLLPHNVDQTLAFYVIQPILPALAKTLLMKPGKKPRKK